MATVRSFSGYRIGSATGDIDLGGDNSPDNGETFTIPASGPNISFLVEDEDGTASGDGAGDVSNDQSQSLYAFDSAGNLIPGTNGDTFFVEATITFTVNGASFVGYYIETEDGDDYLILPPNVPAGTATITATDFDTGAIDYASFESGDENVTDDTSALDLTGADTIFSGDGNDTVTSEGGADVVSAGAGDDSVSAGAGADSVTGGSGDDTIDGGGDDDTLDGGLGDDTIFGGAGNDSITGGGGADTIEGGDGNDNIQGDVAGVSEATSERLSFNWSQLEEAPGNTVDDGDNLNAGVSQDTGGIVVSVDFTNDGDANVGAGTAFDFNSSDVQFVSGIDGGGETVNANSALFLGGDGGATAGANNATSTTRINFASSDPALEDEVTNVQFRINDIDTGSWQDIVRITAFDADGNQITVNLTESAGNLFDLSDSDGVPGNDTATALDDGSGGANTNPGTAVGSMLVEIPGPVSRIEIDYGNLDTGEQRIDVTDIFFDTIPSTLADSIDGGAGDDTILGQAGDDILIGGADDDSVSGGDGDDTITGGTGDDNLAGDADQDTFLQTDGFGTDTIFGGSTGTDNDTIDASNLTAGGINIVLTANEDGTISDQTNPAGTFDDIENFILSEQDDLFDASVATNSRTIDGEGGDDSLIGGTVADTIDAGTGDDTVRGGTGDDSLDGGDGFDTADYSTASGPVRVDLLQNTATGADGNDIVNNFENVVGSSSDDTLTGDGGDNTLDGNGGNDTLDGGGGNDTLITDGGDTVIGGGGDDTADFRDPDGAGNDIDVVIDSSNLTGTDSAGGVYSEVETFIADELDGANPEGDGTDDAVDDDAITISNVITPAEVSNLDDTATGTFTPANGDPVVSFGGPGEPTLSDLFTSGPGGGPRNGDYQITGGDTDGTIGNVTFQNYEEVNFTMVCFARGTMIATPDGERPVEELAEGDLVLTRDRGAQKLRWTGSRKVPAEGRLAPVVFRAGAIGNDRELVVSPLHRMLVTDWRAELMFGELEVLAAAKDLVNGDTIFVQEGGEVEYFHILFDAHEIVTANGAPSESFHPGETALSMLEEAAREEILTIFPELRGDKAEGYGQAARPSLKSFEARLLGRAAD